jgi:hypothetical protein
MINETDSDRNKQTASRHGTAGWNADEWGDSFAGRRVRHVVGWGENVRAVEHSSGAEQGDHQHRTTNSYAAMKIGMHNFP